MTTEPTDDELDEILCGQWPAFSMQATLVRMWVRQAMRDAITRLGQPAGGVEPLRRRECLHQICEPTPAPANGMGAADTRSMLGI